jgi:MFS family permease
MLTKASSPFKVRLISTLIKINEDPMANSANAPAIRQPGMAQGMTLISLAWVSTVAAVVIAPILPEMSRAYADVPNVDIKIPLVATGPSLLVALLSLPFGFLADRIGRRGLLLAMLFVYGVAGTSPIWLNGLDQIVASRLALGLAEAAIMTTGTALISDYFHGRSRERWLAVQTGTAPLTAVFLVLLGGLLGGFGWRTPFYVYSFGFILIPLVLMFIWEPLRDASAASMAVARDTIANFSWSKPVWASLSVSLSMIMFMVTVVQFSFLVTERGMTMPQQIGMWSSLVTLGNPIGSLIFSFNRAKISVKLTIAYTLFAIGFAIMASVPTVAAAIAGGFIANLGAGFYLPTAITWLLSTLPAALVGRGSGLFTSAIFLGQFLGPLAILALSGLTGSLSHAILACGVLCTGAAVATLMITMRGLKAAT